jgi:NAD+ synthase (glutamine-hydrolysing)
MSTPAFGQTIIERSLKQVKSAMQDTPVIVFAQVDALVGDIPGNAQKIIAWSRKARESGRSDLVVFPELMLTGYPPEDLLLRPSLQRRVEAALKAIEEALPDIDLIIGLPWREDGRLYNCAAYIHGGRICQLYKKRCLPNYQVFDEKRYFHEGSKPCVFKWQGITIGLTVCEDIWDDTPARETALAGADILININASPFHVNKQAQRVRLVQDRALAHNLPVVYVNLVGGQDELVFDGGSFAVNANGEVCLAASQFEEDLYRISTGELLHDPVPFNIPEVESATSDETLYRALVIAVRDYVNKNRFKSVILGLSGGIDSALTLAIACDALGPERVRAVMMPFRYTSQMSLDDASAEALALGATYDVIPIESIYESFMGELAPMFEGLPKDTTEENIQARIRGVLLMSLSNKTGALVLTTGNKSEMAVGYATLYGDMAGGFDVLKDIYKTRVFKLARYRNSVSDCIPERVITRPPSAELAPDQKDEDSLPPYAILDQILELYIEQDFSADAIVARGFDKDIVYRFVRLVDINEYKRRQAPVGPRLTPRGFGRDRRYPITSGWKVGE